MFERISQYAAAGERHTPDSPDFFDACQSQIHGLLVTAGRPDLWSDDLNTLVQNTQPFNKGDHFQALNPLKVNPYLHTKVRAGFSQLGMTGEIPAAAGEYDHVIILGGLMATNDTRTGFALRQLERPDGQVRLRPDATVTLWAGPRAYTGQEALATQQALASPQTAIIAERDAWLRRQLALSATHNPNESPIKDETAQGRLSLLRHFGSRALVSQIHLRWFQAQDNHIVSKYVMGSPTSQGSGRLELMNALPASRASLQGADRHTTESCAKEWAGQTLQANGKERILFVSSNPYIRRTGLVVRQVLRAEGFSGVSLTDCGPAAPEDMPLSVMFGELARLLYATNQERCLTAASDIS